MAKLDDYLDPFEQVIWRGKPYKKAFNLEAFTLQAWGALRLRNEEYMITNQRLLIKKGLRKEDVWFTRLEKIKK